MSAATILCVENVAENTRTPVVDYLETKGFHVIRSIDGWDAVKKIVTRQPDLVLLDLRLPKLDGLTVIDVLKLTHINVGMPIVLCSEEPDREQLQVGMRLGATDVMFKPIAFEDLIARINTFLFELFDSDIAVLTDKVKQLEPLNFIEGLDPKYLQGRKGYVTSIEEQEVAVLMTHAEPTPEGQTQSIIVESMLVFQKTPGGWRKIFPRR